jgi:hypothetical protein
MAQCRRSREQFVQGNPVRAKSQRTLRVLQTRQAILARAARGVAGFSVSFMAACSPEAIVTQGPATNGINVHQDAQKLRVMSEAVCWGGLNSGQGLRWWY